MVCVLIGKKILAVNYTMCGQNEHNLKSIPGEEE